MSIKNISAKLVLTLVIVFGLSIVSKADVIRMVVKEDLASCTGVAPMTCMQVKYKNSKSWELFYGGINGFKYQPGYRYVILVDRTKRKNVPADASAYEYKLKKILKKQKMKLNAGNSAWDFVLKHKWKLIQMNGVSQKESPVYMVFDKDKNRVHGSSACNTFMGGFEKTTSSLTFKQLAGTLMACDEARNKIEGAFLQLMNGGAFRYDVADQTLNLYRGNKLVLMFGMAPL